MGDSVKAIMNIGQDKCETVVVVRSPQEVQRVAPAGKGEAQQSSMGGNSNSRQTETMLQDVASSLNDAMSFLNQKVSFSYNEKAGMMTVKVTDVETNQVIREMPPEEVLKLKERMTELVGLIFNGKA